MRLTRPNNLKNASKTQQTSITQRTQQTSAHTPPNQHPQTPMANDIRLSGPTLRVLKLLIEKPPEGRSGADISRTLGISSGTLYPLLARLENAGWLKSEWEQIDPSQEGRPRRRFYKLTGFGQTSASRALAELQTDPGVLVWNSSSL